MAPPLNAHLANERTYLAWIDMSVALGAVSIGLLSTSMAGADAASAAARLSAQSAFELGAALAPVAMAFTVYSGYLFYSRRKLLREGMLFSKKMQTTTAPVVLGCCLVVSLVVVLWVNLTSVAYPSGPSARATPSG